MKLYTRGGDSGQTALRGGERVSKSSDRVAAYGDLDELGAVLGMARAAEGMDEDVGGLLADVQGQLFWLSADLAATDKAKRYERAGQEEIDAMEEAIDRFDGELVPLQSFVLAGGTPAAAHLHHARTVCRRAERSAVALSETETVEPVVLGYLNRLSDLLFCLARIVNKRAGVADELVEL